MGFCNNAFLFIPISLFATWKSFAQQHLTINDSLSNSVKWTMIGTNMIRIQDFDFSNSNPIDSICCGQKSTYLDRATVTFGFGLYTKLSERWSLSGDFGISYGSIRSKTPITSDKWKTWSQAGNAEVNYQLSERGLLRPYVFSGINGIFRKSTFYGTKPLGLGLV